MRYQDWDVLLFPAGEEAAHVPVKEFRTQCYVEQKDHVPQHELIPTPLLTTFIPSLARNAPFQVSIHSWTKTGPMHGGVAAKEAWHVKVVIDGACVAAENFAIDVNWPQILTSDNQAHKLRFPPFHRTILSQNSWSASDPMGRIRVELSSGYLDEKYARFVKVMDHVNFAFQPGPIDILEHNGVAWPNARMFQNPIQSPAFMGAPVAISNTPTLRHKRVASTSNINLPMAFGGLATTQPTSHFNHYVHDTNSNYDASSRSTSAYSIVPDSVAPLLKKDSFVPVYTGTYPEGVRKGPDQQLNIRLPSDQLDLIIKALQVPHQTQHIGEAASAMPPPPIPQHVTPVKENVQSEQQTTSSGLTFPPFGENGVNGTNGATTTNRRDDSRFSDISMHQGCTSFPACTTEDSEGAIMHSTNCTADSNLLSAPGTVVRGRKEGSSPTKPRDFFSTILDTMAAVNRPPTEPGPMETQSPAQASKEPGMATALTPGLLTSSSPADAQGTRKRMRSALKSLNINDGGSPEKMGASTVAKPPRKASRGSVSSIKANQENQVNVIDGQENMMVDA